MNTRYGIPSLVSLAAAALLAAAPPPAAAEPLDLLGAYRLAAQNDPAFLSAGAVRDAGLESEEIARAALLPSVSVRGSAAMTADDIHDPPGSGSDTYPDLSLSLEASQSLYRPELSIRLGQARLREEKAESDYAVRAQDLIDRVVDRYFGVLEARDDYRFAQTNREAIEQQLRQAQQRFEVGLVAITDVEEAKSRFDLAHAREIGAKNDADNAREAMRETIGEYPDELAALGEDTPLAVPEPPDIEEWTRTAEERNLLVRSATLAVAIAKEDIRLAAAGGEPSVDLFGQVATTDRNRKPRGSEASSATIGIRLNWPFYTGGRVSAETRRARADHRDAMHIQERARRDAVRLTRQAYLGVESAIARVGALRQAVVSSQSALDAIEAGFQVGTRTSVDVLDAQRDLFQAQNDLVAARYDYIRNALKLRLAAGTLGLADLEAINAWLE